jgi:hypothetical protein
MFARNITQAMPQAYMWLGSREFFGTYSLCADKAPASISIACTVLLNSSAKNPGNTVVKTSANLW